MERERDMRRRDPFGATVALEIHFLSCPSLGNLMCGFSDRTAKGSRTAATDFCYLFDSRPPVN